MVLDSASSRIMDSEVNKDDYQVVSKPSVANKTETYEENMRQSVIEKKLSI